MLQIAVKVVVTLCVILAATAVGKKWPSLAGLIGTMPLTALLIMIWLHVGQRGDSFVMRGYTKGAFFGIFPSMAFFGIAQLCYRKGLPLGVVLSVSFAAWLAGAVMHQALLRG